ncbi:MAG: hypothetical protein U0842_25925 [Candidatus Binatia bacterium]
MRTRNRSHGDDAPQGAAQGSNVASERRNEAERLANEADALLDRALSGDSQRFLEANRQRGGQ